MDNIDKICKAGMIIMALAFILSIVLSCKAEAEITTILTPDGTITCSTQGGITICF